MRQQRIQLLGFLVVVALGTIAAVLTIRALGYYLERGSLSIDELQLHIVVLASFILGAALVFWLLAVLLPQQVSISRLKHGIRNAATGGGVPTQHLHDPVALALRDTLAELETARLKLLASERLAAMGYFAGGIAHQIGNPLSAARQYIELLTAQAERGDIVDAKIASKARYQLDRIHRAIEGLSRFARPDRIEIAAVELRPFLQRTVELVQSTWPGHADIELSIPDSAVVYSDPLALEQACINFVRNGLEAQQASPQLWIRALRDNGEIRIDIVDDGPGFPDGFSAEAVLQSDKLGGTGLGVPIAVRLIELVGGRVEFLQGDRGACVRLRIPTGEDVPHETGN